MKKAQGLPITTVVLIVICIMVLVVIVLFFFGGFGSGQSSVNTFQCQQQCQTINVLINGKQVCSTSTATIATINSIQNYCTGKCDTKTACALPKTNNGCGYDTTGLTGTPILKCDSAYNPPRPSVQSI